MDFDIRFNLEIDYTDDGTDCKYDILDILDLINSGQVSIQKQGDERVLIDNTRGNVRIGKITNVILA